MSTECLSSRSFSPFAMASGSGQCLTTKEAMIASPLLTPTFVSLSENGKLRTIFPPSSARDGRGVKTSAATAAARTKRTGLMQASLEVQAILTRVRQVLIDGQEGLGAVLRSPLGFERGQELVDERRAGQRQAARAGGGEDDREVLLLVLHGEGGLEVSVDHLLSEDLESPRARGARGERFVKRGQRKARLRGERESLGNAHEVV